MGDKFQDGIRTHQLMASLDAEITILNETVKDLKDTLQFKEESLQRAETEVKELNGLSQLKKDNPLLSFSNNEELKSKLDFAVDLLKQSQPDAQSAPSLHGRIREFLSTITFTKGTESKG